MTTWAHRYSEPLLWLACAALVVALSCVPRCARAGEIRPAKVRVTPALVCSVHDAIKLAHSPRWNPAMCEKVADALNETADSLQMLAIAVNESDLRETAIHWRATGGADVGLMGVFCDVEKGAKDDTCKNGPGRMWVGLHELLDPVVNIHVAAVVLAGHGGNLRRYNGGSKEHGYEARIKAIQAALGGEVMETDTLRMGKLVRQIAKAVREWLGR